LNSGPLPLVPIYAPIPGEGVTSGSWTMLLIYISFALFFSFFCSLLEAALLSSSRSYIETAAQKGGAAAQLMLKHKLNVERPISAILTLNTIAHTVGAAGAGAEAAGIFGNEFVGLISAIMTLLILVLTEIIPKIVGAVYWQVLMPFAAYAIQMLVIVLYPFVWVFHLLAEKLRPETEQPTITRTELSTLATIGEQEGTLEARESHILRTLLQLEDVSVSDIMTPRIVVFALRESMTVSQVIEQHRVLPYSRIPVYNDTVDNITGYVLRHDVLKEAADDRLDTPLTHLKKEIEVVVEMTSLPDALDRFIAQREQLMLVIDEFGGTAGIVTLEDAIETLLGIDILDESEAVEDMRTLTLQRIKAVNRQRLSEALS